MDAVIVIVAAGAAGALGQILIVRELLVLFYGKLDWVPGPGRLDVFYDGLVDPVTGVLLIDSAMAGEWDIFWNAVSHVILPAAILSRLMVRLHAHIWQAMPGQPVRWRNGLVIHGDGCRAFIIADPIANRLSISLDGPTPQRRHLLAVVRAQLAEIHASFAQLEAEAWVPLPDQPGKAALPRPCAPARHQPAFCVRQFHTGGIDR